LDRIIERGAQNQVSGYTIVYAVRSQACLTDDNRWVEPARRIVIFTDQSDSPRPAAPGSPIDDSPEAEEVLSNHCFSN
jgi:hypothetical protein